MRQFHSVFIWFGLPLQQSPPRPLFAQLLSWPSCRDSLYRSELPFQTVWVQLKCTHHREVITNTQKRVKRDVWPFVSSKTHSFSLSFAHTHTHTQADSLSNYESSSVCLMIQPLAAHGFTSAMKKKQITFVCLCSPAENHSKCTCCREPNAVRFQDDVDRCWKCWNDVVLLISCICFCQ